MFAAHALSALLSVTPIQTDCLFVLAHAGETNELLPIMEEMQTQKRDFHVLPLGVAKELIQNRLPAQKILDAEEFGVAIDKQWPIDKELPQDTVLSVAQAVHAKVLVTGVAMLPQKQFLEAYKNQAQTVAYWDNPEPRGAILYFDIAHKVQAVAKKVLFPSGFVASAKEFESHSEAQKIVIGKPTLLQTIEQLGSIDKASVIKKLDFNKDLPVVVFIGTYGDRYEKAFRMFTQSIKGLPYQAIFQIHPMASGEFEKKCSAEFLDDQKKFLISSPRHIHGVTMFEAMAASDLVVTYNSSAGFQALLGGKQVLCVVPEGDAYSNSLIEQGIAHKADSPQAIIEELAKGHEISSVDLLKTMKIPTDPKDRFLSFLDRELGRVDVK